MIRTPRGTNFRASAPGLSGAPRNESGRQKPTRNRKVGAATVSVIQMRW